MEEHLRTFLQTRFDSRANNVVFIGEGWFSQAFAFDVDDQKLIVRLNEYEEDFLKDQFAYTRLASLKLPIPKIIRIGKFDEQNYFAITERCEGKIILEDEMDAYFVPSLYAALDAIHQRDTAQHTGWGLTDSHGNGLFESWGDYLISLYNQKFDYDWRDLTKNTFWENDLFENYFDEMKRLIAHCPAEKYVVHGDYGFSNVMVDNDQITGVLDWAEMKLGDFLYDVAYLEMWSDRIPYANLWRDQARTEGREVPHFAERMRCYLLHQGLGTLAIAAHKRDERMYEKVKEQLARKLNDPTAQ